VSKINSARVLIQEKEPWKFHDDRIIITQVFTRHSQNPFTRLSYKPVDESPQKLVRRNANVTEHTPKVSTRSVNPYARESSREKRQQDRRLDRQTDGRTDRQTHRRIVQNHFSRRFEGYTSQIRSYLEVDFLHDANTSTSIDMEVITDFSQLFP